MQITVHGYAVSGGGRGIERVDVSFDGGKTWVEASRYQKTGNPYVTEKVAKAVSYYCSLINITFVEVYTINLMLVHQAKS